MKKIIALSATLIMLMLFSTVALADSGHSQIPSASMTHDSAVPYMSYAYWQGDIMRYNLHSPSGRGESNAIGLVPSGTPIEDLYDAQGNINTTLFSYFAENNYDFISLDTTDVIPGDYRFVYICPLVYGSVIQPAFAFYDVTIKAKEAPVAWAVEEVGKAANHYLIPSEISNRYTAPITRDHFMLLINSLFLSKTAQDGPNRGMGLIDFAARKNLSVYDCPFEDVNNRYFGDSSHDYVVAANKLGILNGKSDTVFDPNGLLTRQEAATILYRTAKVLGVDFSYSESSYGDSGSVADWAIEGIGYVTTKGIMNGTGNNMFEPQGTYTYQQAYITVYRMLIAMSGQRADSDAAESDGNALPMSTPFAVVGEKFTITSAGVDNSLRNEAVGIDVSENLFAVKFLESDLYLDMYSNLGYNHAIVIYRQAYLLAPDGTRYYRSYEGSWSDVERTVGFSVPVNIDTSSLVFVIAGQTRKLI